MNSIVRIRLFGHLCENAGTFRPYQNYFVQGFRQLVGVDFGLAPAYADFCYRLTDRRIRGAYWAWDLLNSIANKRRSVEADHVGRYVFQFNSNSIKVCIDSADGKDIRDTLAYDWSDIYFKTNKWTNYNYPANVLPLTNGNGLLTAEKIAQIKLRRKRDKEIDLIFMTNIYESSNKDVFHNNIEHHVRLFETLARLDCTKFLKAVIPAGLPDNVMGKYLARLDRAGVPWSRSWDGMSSLEFWDNLARAKLVFLRPGKHGSISWRMTDLLCMGACIVCDLAPYPEWPVPLVAGRNFVDCGCGLGRDESLPPIERYNNIRAVIERLLLNQSTMDDVANENRDYFDAHGSPSSVADYIVNTVKRWVHCSSIDPAARDRRVLQC